MNSALGPLVRRSLVSCTTRSTLLRGGASPPLPPFARIPPPSQKLTEQSDAVFDDGVAPELAFDFDAQHISSAEGLAWWAGGLSFFGVLYYYIKNVQQPEPPAASRLHDMVIEPVRRGPPKKAQN